MAATSIQDIRDFHDVVRLLEEHPEWRAELRCLILRDELLALPQQMARLTEQVSAEMRARLLSDRTFNRLEALEAWAAARGHSLLELAFAWLLGYPAVATVIAGAAQPGQAATNATAAGWVLTPDEVAEVTAVVRDAA